MRTALDSNILSALWSKEPLSATIANGLGEAKLEGGLAISAPVYAELLAYPRATESFIDGFLTDTNIEVDFQLERSTWVEAGRRFARYASRRRKASREEPKRLLADFLIGSHALLQADRFITLDASRYRSDFPDLHIVSIIL